MTRRTLRVGGQSIVGLALTTPTVALSLTSGALYEGNAAVYAVTLSRPWVDDVTVAYASSNGTAAAGTDYTNTSGTVTIPAGATSAVITVPTTLRSGAQLSRTFTLTISSAIDAGGDALTITAAAVLTTILDTAAAPTFPTLSVAAVAPANEGDPLTFRVTASFAPTANITFSYATSNGTATAGTDYTSASGTGTITAGTASTDIAVTTAERAGFQGARTLTMTISSAASGGDAVTITGAAATGTIAETEVPTGDHAYFETLLARSDFWKAHSMRPQAGETSTSSPYYDKQLLARSSGGYVANPSSQAPAAAIPVTYSPNTDTDSAAQDACKVVIPCFLATGWAPHYLRESIDASQTVLPLVDTPNSSIVPTRSLKIDNEVVTITAVDRTADTVTVTRGQFGSTAAAHAAGAECAISTNSIPRLVRFPINLVEGYSYFLSFECYDTASYLNYNTHSHKRFNFSRPTENIWLEPRARFDGGTLMPPNSPAPGYNRSTDVYTVDLRSYQNPNLTETDWSLTNGNVRHPDNKDFQGGAPVIHTSNNSMLGYQIVKPNEWTRWYFEWTLKENDWDRVRFWVATESRAAALLYDIQLSVPVGANGVRQVDYFWLEYDSSTEYIVRPDLRDLVSYCRNLVILRKSGLPDASWEALLEQP